MKNKISIFFLLVLSSFKIISAQSSVWKVESDSSTVYIGGTIHVLRDVDYPLPIEFEKAFKAADQLVFETNIDEMSNPDIVAEMMKKFIYSDDRTLKSELSKDAYDKLVKESKKLNVSVDKMQKYKPSMVLLTLTMQGLKKIGVKQDGVDKYYDIHGKKNGKEIGALESAEFQINLITSLGEGNESEYVLSSLKDFKKLQSDFLKIIAAWKKGERKYFVKQLKDMKREYPAMYKSMFLDRNNNWIPKIDAYLSDKKTEFILVGNLHLHGENGILQLLEKKGYKISQVSVSKEEESELVITRNKREEEVNKPIVKAWEIVHGEASGFTALTPGKVTITNQIVPSELGDLKMDMFSHTPAQGDDNIIYMVIHSVYPEGSVSSEDKDGIDGFFESAIGGAVSKVKGKILTQKDLSLSGYPGKEVTIDFNDGMFIIALRIYLVKNTVYMLQIISETKKVGNVSSNRFMESLKLIEK